QRVRAEGPRPVILAATLLVACSPSVPAPARTASDGVREPAGIVLRDFVRTNRARYAAALARGRTFLDGLDVDPTMLRARGLKGKKKLVEALDAYSVLLRVSPRTERPSILARVVELARFTTEDRYHDMLAIDDRQF